MDKQSSSLSKNVIYGQTQASSMILELGTKEQRHRGIYALLRGTKFKKNDLIVLHFVPQAIDFSR